MEDLQVYIERSFSTDCYKFHFILRRPDKTYRGNIVDNGTIQFEEINPEISQEDKPAIVLNDRYFVLFGRAMLKALEENHIEPEEKKYIEGKYESTKYHLEDLRKLLKLTKSK